MNGTLYDRGSLPPDLHTRFGTSLGISPVCYVRERSLLLRHLDCLGRAAATLGYEGLDLAAAAAALASLDVRDWEVALVPTPLDHRAGPPGRDWMLVAQPFVAPDASPSLRFAVSPHARNHESPTRNALILGDGELLQGTRLASTVDRDDLLWLTLDGAVSCAGSSAVFADIEGAVVTPPLADGVPESAWREAVLAELGAAERRLVEPDLRAATAVASLWPWGAAQPVSEIGDATLAAASGRGSLVTRMTAAIAAVGNR